MGAATLGCDKRRIFRAARIAVFATAVVAVAAGGSAWADSLSDWSAYLNGSSHNSFNRSETTITPKNAHQLVRDWHFSGIRPTGRGQPGFLSSPTVYRGAVYIGSQTGWFYKLSALTGKVLAKRFIGFIPGRECGAADAGFVATATVAIDPSTGEPMVYAAGANEVLYAMRASDLHIKWRRAIVVPSKVVSDYYQWSSPTVAHGRIYIGIASHCGKPMVRGGLVSYRQATGRQVARFYVLPSGRVGGSIWSSAAVGSAGDIYVSTGNPNPGIGTTGFTDAVVQLSPDKLRPLASFHVPAGQVVKDGDFGASPSLFGKYVAACNKNGILYVLNRLNLKLAWSRRIGAAFGKKVGIGRCISAASYDRKRLYIGADQVRIGGKTFRGSVVALDPATGRRAWITGLPNSVLTAPSLDGAGLLAVGTYDTSSRPNAVYLINAATGRIVRTLRVGGVNFAQSVFAEGRIYTANDQGVSAWGLPR